jgi:uncharacterized protein YjiS (DUF1127 family)
MAVQAHQALPFRAAGIVLARTFFSRAKILCRERATALPACIAEWRARARSRRELSTVMDEIIRDVGLTRAEAKAEIRKPFWQG